MYELLGHLSFYTLFGTVVLSIGAITALAYLAAGIVRYQKDLGNKIQQMTVTSAVLFGITAVSLFICTITYITSL